MSKHRRIRKTHKKRKSLAKRRYRGGSCGCDKSMTGGSGMGSLPTFSLPASNSYIPLNEHNLDPTSPSNVGSEHLLGNPNGMGHAPNPAALGFFGGKRRHRKSNRTKRTKRTRRKMHGGYSFLNNDAVSLFGTSDGAQYSADMLSGKAVVSSNTYDQPAESLVRNYSSSALV